MLILVFEAVLRMSIFGLAAAGLAALAGAVVHRLPVSRSVVLVLWAAAAVRLVCPITIPLPGGVSGRLDQAVDQGFAWLGFAGTGRVSEWDRDVWGMESAREAAGPGGSGGQEDRALVSGASAAEGNSTASLQGEKENGGPGEHSGKTDGGQGGRSDRADGSQNGDPGAADGGLGGFFGRAGSRWETVLAAVWFAGVFVVWGCGIGSMFCFRRRLRFAIRAEENIYESDAIASSCIAGLLHPRIYLIPGLTGEVRGHVVCHEREHILHRDQLWNMLAYAVMGLHWYNLPLWVLYRVFGRELEQCCDERVIRRIGADQKENYCETLLTMAARRGKQVFAAPAFGENRGKQDMRKRMERVLQYRQPKKWVQMTALAAAVALGAGMLSQGAVAEPETRAEMERNGRTGTEAELRQASGMETGRKANAETELERKWLSERETEADVETELKPGVQAEEMMANEEKGKTSEETGKRMEEEMIEELTEKMTELQPELVELAGKLYEKKNPYVGDAPADGALLELLRPYLPDTEISMELETDERPYVLRLRLSKNAAGLTGRSAAQETEDAAAEVARETYGTAADEAEQETYGTAEDRAEQETYGTAADEAEQATYGTATDGAPQLVPGEVSAAEDILQSVFYADLYRPAGVLLALIENLDAVAFEYPGNVDSESLANLEDWGYSGEMQTVITEYYDADWFAGNDELTADIKAYGESEERVRELLTLLDFSGSKPERYYEGNCSVGIIGGADGPTSIFLAGKLGSNESILGGADGPTDIFLAGKQETEE